MTGVKGMVGALVILLAANTWAAGTRDLSEGLPRTLAHQGPRNPASDQVISTPEAAAAPLTSPSTQPSPSMPPDTVHLWSVREGINDGTLTNVIVYRAERVAETSTLTRLAPPPGQDKTVVLSSQDESQLREKISKITSTLAYKPTPKTKETCSHWIEFDSFYGKRFFCDGYDSGPATDFISTLQGYVR